MRKSGITLLLLFIGSISFCKEAPAKDKNVYSKYVWSDINLDQKINNPLFGPLNDEETMPGYNFSEDRHDLDLFETNRQAIQWNLWTILKYYILKGDLTIFTPYNPDWFVEKDKGFLNYPFTAGNFGSSAEGTFLTDEKFREEVKEYGFLGRYDRDTYPVAMMSTIYPGEDSINNNGDVVYYPPEFYWFEDRDIISYRIKEKWIINQAGEVQDKILEAIAPVVNQFDRTGVKVGTMELFWVDYTVLQNLLANYYILLDRYRTERVISYQEYFEKREFYAEVDTSMAVKVNVE